jgi:nicotinate phosphoribosyltransferase
MSVDLAQRVHNHNFRLDPFVRSLLDTDFYKILMAQFIFTHFRKPYNVTFAVKNRSVSRVKLSSIIPISELRAQLDYVKNLKFTEAELIWLQGNTFYGQKNIFTGDFIEALRNLRLPDYELTVDTNGEYDLQFTGAWFDVMFWEIYALAILNEARARKGMADMSSYQLRVLYANATSKLVGKLKALKTAGVPRIAEFGTRRRHGFLWQGFVIEAMAEELGDNFLGTSNALHSMQQGLPAIGTNAHELSMVYAAVVRLVMWDRDPSIQQSHLNRSQFDVLRLWEDSFQGNLLVALPDTFGTTQFLRKAKEEMPEIRNWRGFREDSKDPYVGGEEKISFWKSIGCDPLEKLQLFSDGLDVEQMIGLHQKFGGRIMDGYGWGTLATNDFRDCDPRGGNALDPISIVCKVRYVEDTLTGQKISAVKMSDNYEKATGDADEVAFYRGVFGSEGMTNAPVVV